MSENAMDLRRPSLYKPYREWYISNIATNPIESHILFVFRSRKWTT